jgi:DNA-directed RNA polymerase subunit RPC12/RpoP
MRLTPRLDLNRCPHCNIANPNITATVQFEAQGANGGYVRIWKGYVCQSCGGAILASMRKGGDDIALQFFPETKIVEECIPERARAFLNQALETLQSPAGSIMLSASSIDAMLKDKGYKEGNLYNRIEDAAKNHLITDDMSTWAHQIRLEANDQRHADENVNLPTQEDAKRIVEFALALAEILYVLPNKVIKGIESTRV